MIEWETPYFLKKKVNTVYPNLGKYKIVKWPILYFRRSLKKYSQNYQAESSTNFSNTNTA